MLVGIGNDAVAKAGKLQCSRSMVPCFTGVESRALGVGFRVWGWRFRVL